MTLYEEITALPTLRLGWARTRQNSDMAGTDDVTTRMFALRLERELEALHDELARHTYTALPLLRFGIPKPNGETRMLAIPCVRDRVVQSAALVVLQPIVEREMETCSFAYRPGLSYTDAIRRLSLLRDEGYEWVVDADIEAYFDHVEHDLLLARFAELVPDTGVQGLVRQWITADAVYDGRRYERTEGLPQGSVVSPLLANLFLDRLDEALMAEGYEMVRYADDFVILCKTKPQAETALQLTASLLADLELSLHREKTRVTSFDQGFKFLGSLFVRSLVVPTKQPALEVAPVIAPAESDAEGDAGRDDAAGAPTVPALPEEDDLDRTALGRAFLRALDAEGVTLPSFVASMTGGDAQREPAEDHPGDALDASPAASPETTTDEGSPVDPVRTDGPVQRSLYIQEQGATLRYSRGRFVVTGPGAPNTVLLSLPTFKVHHVLIFGSCTITPAALRYCLKHDVPITLLSSRGVYYGRVTTGLAGDVKRQRLQFLHTLDTPFRLDLARRFVRGKLTNARSLLRRYARRLGDTQLDEAAAEVDRVLRLLDVAETLEQAMGYEGRGAAVYFGVFGRLLAGSDFTFQKRVRRPPTDPVNAMLSFGYTLLFGNVYTFVQLHRLHPFVGFLHEERAGHPALVSDLIEEFRFLIDRMVLRLCNGRHLTPGDFYHATPDDPSSGCFLTAAGRKTFLRAFERAMRREVTPKDVGYPMSYRRCLGRQVRALAIHLEGGTPYEPFTIY